MGGSRYATIEALGEVCSAATIKNPAELAAALTGKPVEWIQESGAPRGERADIRRAARDSAAKLN